MPPVEISRLYENADLFVFPSRKERFGMVLVEALSFGLPIIASMIPTTVAIIKNNIIGLLYNTEDILALARAIRILVKNANLRIAIIQTNIQKSKKLSNWKGVGANNCEIILPFLKE